MLNRLDEKRSSKAYDVKAECHGGCTVKFVHPFTTNVSIKTRVYYFGTLEQTIMPVKHRMRY